MGAEPSDIEGAQNVCIIRCHQRSSYYAMAVIELGQAVGHAVGR